MILRLLKYSLLSSALAVVAVLLALLVLMAQVHAAEIEGLTMDHPAQMIGISSPDNGQDPYEVQQALVANHARHPGLAELVIDSPGGAWGLQARALFDAMDQYRSTGTVVRCFVKGQAMSLAMITLSHCSEIYAAPTAKLMWHRARIFMQGRANALELFDLVKQLLALDTMLWEPLRQRVNNDALFFDALNKERVWKAAELQEAVPALGLKIAILMLTP